MSLYFNLVGIVLLSIVTLLISSLTFLFYSSLCCYELQNEKGKSWQGVSILWAFYVP